MEASTWGFIGTIAGALVGSLSSVLTTIITGWNTRKIQAHSDSLSRQERAREFQRTNLLELQEELARHLRLIGRAHLEDLRNHRQAVERDHFPLLSAELDQDLADSNRKLSLLVERLAHDSLRASIKALRGQIGDLLTIRSAYESDLVFRRVIATSETTMEELGVILRGHY